MPQIGFELDTSSISVVRTGHLIIQLPSVGIAIILKL